ncbi:MAG: transglutaminase-like cysteine peptidase [Kiloniellaceae bacterium]
MLLRGSTAVRAIIVFLALAALRPGATQAQTLAEVARAGQTARAGLFGSIEFRAESLDGLPQWTRVLAAMEKERGAFARCVRVAARCTTPALRSWRKIIAAAASLDRAARLRAVNDYFNRWPYRQDPDVYGRSEYWATPSEFMARSGDCEDYAVAKYFALRQLGFGKDEMRIVILTDEIRGIGHAVLAIYGEDGILVLDSLSNLIVSDDRYKHYVAQYSMNETTRWAHVGGFERKSKPAYRGLVARR